MKNSKHCAFRVYNKLVALYETFDERMVNNLASLATELLSLSSFLIRWFSQQENDHQFQQGEGKLVA